jgi:predicted DNA-binding protein (MmcQ/YjbR family)
VHGKDALARLRAICMSLPEAAERLSHGEPAWFAGTGRMFACFADHHHDDVLGCWCAAPFGRQQELTGLDPGRYFVPPYVGSRGWLGVRLDVPVDWTEIAEIVQDGYREVASRRLVTLLNAGLGHVGPGDANVTEAIVAVGGSVP